MPKEGNVVLLLSKQQGLLVHLFSGGKKDVEKSLTYNTIQSILNNLIAEQISFKVEPKNGKNIPKIFFKLSF